MTTDEKRESSYPGGDSALLLCTNCYNTIETLVKYSTAPNDNDEQEPKICSLCLEDILTDTWRRFSHVDMCDRCRIRDLKKLFIFLPKGIYPLPYPRLDQSRATPVLISDGLIYNECNRIYHYQPTTDSLPQILKDRAVKMGLGEIDMLVRVMPTRQRDPWDNIAKWHFIDHPPRPHPYPQLELCPYTTTYSCGWAVKEDKDPEVALFLRDNQLGGIAIDLASISIDEFLAAEQEWTKASSASESDFAIHMYHKYYSF